MTMHDVIEARLLRAFEVTPSEDGLRRLNQRVARAMAQPAAITHRGLGGRRLFLRPLLILAAFILLTGAVVGGARLLDQIFESSGSPGWHTAWDRAERLDLSQTDAGVTITLERAYADLNQVLMGFTIEGLPAAPVTGHGEAYPIEWRAELRDPMGRTPEQWATSGSGGELVDTNLAAVVRIWEGSVAPVAGTWVLTVRSIGYNAGGFVSGECYVGNTDPACDNPPPKAMIDGTWRFEFALPAPAGVVVAPNVSKTVGDATLTLTELRVTPTMISARVGLRVAGDSVDNWGPAIGWGPWVHNLSIRRDGVSYDSNSGYHVTQDPLAQGPDGDVWEFMVPSGSDPASGTWEIEISELTYLSTGCVAPCPEDYILLTGPWTLTVTVP